MCSPPVVAAVLDVPGGVPRARVAGVGGALGAARPLLRERRARLHGAPLGHRLAPAAADLRGTPGRRRRQ